MIQNNLHGNIKRMLSVRGSASPKELFLQKVPRRLYAGMARLQSDERRAKKAGRLPGLCERLPAARPSHPEALRDLRGEENRKEAPGFLKAPCGEMVL
jgi:hypothetical protein